MSVLPQGADMPATSRFAPILLKKAFGVANEIF
jgi:hypothetical protein